MIGKSIIKRFFDYYQDKTLDDETEFFPILKIIILSIADSFKSSSKNAEIESKLKLYLKQLYIYSWLLQAKEFEDEIDVEYEHEEAINRFEEIYKKV